MYKRQLQHLMELRRNRKSQISSVLNKAQTFIGDIEENDRCSQQMCIRDSLYPMILIPGSLNLFRCALTVSNLSDIDRIIKDSRQEGSGEIIVFLSPCFLLGITMLIQIIADGVKSLSLIHI